MHVLVTASFIMVRSMKIWIHVRYKIPKDDTDDVEGVSSKMRVPAKVMWYFPIIPCLKCLFMNKTNAKLMR
jgi:hypothetical protein